MRTLMATTPSPFTLDPYGQTMVKLVHAASAELRASRVPDADAEDAVAAALGAQVAHDQRRQQRAHRRADHPQPARRVLEQLEQHAFGLVEGAVERAQEDERMALAGDIFGVDETVQEEDFRWAARVSVGLDRLAEDGYVPDAVLILQPPSPLRRRLLSQSRSPRARRASRSWRPCANSRDSKPTGRTEGPARSVPIMPRMKIAVPKERAPGERRVALVPEIVAKFVKGGHAVTIERGAGMSAGYVDDAYLAAGASIAPDSAAAYADADVVVRVGKPSESRIACSSRTESGMLTRFAADNGLQFSFFTHALRDCPWTPCLSLAVKRATWRPACVCWGPIQRQPPRKGLRKPGTLRQRFAWPAVSAQVLQAYEDAISTPQPVGATHRLAVRVGVRAADLKPHVPAQRLPTLERKPPGARRSRAAGLARRGGLATVSLGGAALAVLALQKIGPVNIASAPVSLSPAFVLLGLAIMCGAMAMRGFSWHAILRAALPGARLRLGDAMQGTFIGVLMSSTLPARLGEPSRALVVARRAGRPRESFPVVLGTVVSQTLLNVVALAILGAVMFSSVDIFSGHQDALLVAAIAPVALLVLLLLAPVMLRHGAARTRLRRLHTLVAQMRAALTRVRAGLAVFRHPRLGLAAAVFQLAAWGLQLLSCYMLMIALGLGHQAGIAAAAAVLFAVNITAVLPATPANLGVFQAACVAVLHTGWHVGYGTGVAYGVILQSVEVATAIIMGMPALLKEGMSWREVRLRAIHAAPVKLPARPRRPGARRSGAESSRLSCAKGELPKVAPAFRNFVRRRALLPRAPSARRCCARERARGFWVSRIRQSTCD